MPCPLGFFFRMPQVDFPVIGNLTFLPRADLAAQNDETDHRSSPGGALGSSNLLGGFEDVCIFPFSWESSSSQLTHIFFRGVA